MHDAHQVRRERALPRVEVLRRAPEKEAGRVVHQQAHLAKALVDGVAEPLEIPVPADVGLAREHVVRAVRGELDHRLLRLDQRFAVAVGETDAHSARRQSLADGQTDTAGRSRDDRDAARGECRVGHMDSPFQQTR